VGGKGGGGNERRMVHPFPFAGFLKGRGEKKAGKKKVRAYFYPGLSRPQPEIKKKKPRRKKNMKDVASMVPTVSPL